MSTKSVPASRHVPANSPGTRRLFIYPRITSFERLRAWRYNGASGATIL